MVEGNRPRHIDLPPYSEQRTLYRPALIVIAGLPLAGKTTLMKELTLSTNIVGFDVDRERFAEPPLERVVLPSEMERLAVESSYHRVFQKANAVVLQGVPAMIAGVFSRPYYHEMARNLTESSTLPLRIIQMGSLSDKEIQRRLRERVANSTSFSNITTIAQFEEVRRRYQPFPETTKLILPSDVPSEQQKEAVLVYLRDLLVA